MKDSKKLFFLLTARKIDRCVLSDVPWPFGNILTSVENLSLLQGEVRVISTGSVVIAFEELSLATLSNKLFLILATSILPCVKTSLHSVDVKRCIFGRWWVRLGAEFTRLKVSDIFSLMTWTQCPGPSKTEFLGFRTASAKLTRFHCEFTLLSRMPTKLSGTVDPKLQFRLYTEMQNCFL